MNSWLQTIDRFDRQLFLTVYQKPAGKLQPFLQRLTHGGGWYFQTILALAVLLIPGTRRMGVRLAVIQIAVTLLVQILKARVARIRPYQALAGIYPRRPEPDFSFPSGHTAASFATAAVLAWAYPVWTGGCFGLAALIGYSRVCLGVHYPGDILAGSLCGLGVATLMLLWLPF